MNADLPPHSPQRRPVAFVPLDPGPQNTPAHDRAIARQMLVPLRPWQAPAIRTTRHAAAELVPLDEPVAALPAPTPDLVLPVMLGEPITATAPPAAPLSLTDAVSKAERLQTILARERQSVEVAAFPSPNPDVVPLAPRRVPKPVRPDALGRPLSDAEVAAISRATTFERPAVPSLPPTRTGTRARDRMVLIPLGEPVDEPAVSSALPATVSPPPAAARPATLPPPPPPPVIDLREQKPRREAKTRRDATTPPSYPCPACNTKGVIDVIDNITGMVHLSCPACFRMWNTSVTHAAGTRR